MPKKVKKPITRKRRKIRKPRIRYTIKDKWAIARIRRQEGLLGQVICEECRRSFPIDIMEVDHITPVTRDGSGRPTNLRLLCPPCNKRKGSKRPKPRKSPLDLF
ncbi:MAG: HNH endonuclease [Nitrososphaerales archaeon]